MIDLKGQNVLIAGASGGLGRSIAQVLMDCGANLYLGWRSRRDAVDALCDRPAAQGQRVVGGQADFSDYESARGWVDRGRAELGSVDVLVTCTGWSGGTHTPFTEQDPNVWRELIDSQFFAPVNLAHAVLPSMVEARAGRIIFLSADGAKVGQSGLAVANGGNAGVIGFAKSIAREVARYGVTVNVVCAGPTRGPTLDHLHESSETGGKIADAVLRAIPMKRAADPAEVAQMFAFLASSSGSYVTGQAISVSGGLTMS